MAAGYCKTAQCRGCCCGPTAVCRLITLAADTKCRLPDSAAADLANPILQDCYSNVTAASDWAD